MYVMMPFEELHIEIGGVFVGIFDGVADIDLSGRILGVTLEGWDGFKRGAKRTNVYIPIPEKPEMTWGDMFATELAIALYKQFSDDISGTVVDRIVELRTAFRDPGPSQAQRI